MTIAEIKTSIEFLEQRGLIVELFFLFKNNNEISIKKGRLHEDIQMPIVNNIVRPYLEKELNIAEDIIDYNPAITPDRRVLSKISKEEIEQYNLEVVGMEYLDDENRYEDIWAYMIRISQGINQIVLVRKSFPSHILKKDFAMWLRQGRFTKFENNVFSLDKKFDALLINDEFIVFQKTNFEKSFLFDIKMEEQARRNTKEIRDNYNLLEINDASIDEYLDIPTIAKLQKVDMALITDGTMSYDNLSQFCDEFNLSIAKNDATHRFAPQNKAEFKKFIKLLSDDYLESGLTERHYDVHSKERLTT